MTAAYQHLNISRQAHHLYQQQQVFLGSTCELIKQHIQLHRVEHPGCGLKKLYYLMPDCPVGRDEFIAIAMDLGLGIKRRKKRTKTTFSVYTVFKNLIAEKSFNDINLVWMSDITYIKIGPEDAYIVLIEDLYSRRILGYCASFTLAATQNIIALKMAFKTRKAMTLNGLIHHSDRGSQYIAGDYLLMLQDRKIQISMCDSALDNAYVERLNGIIKEEYLDYHNFQNLAQLQNVLKSTVEHYNQIRPHLKLKMHTPCSFEKALENQSISQRTKIFIPKEHF